MRASMECTDVRRLLYDQRHDRLDDMELVLLEAHLQECPSCRDHRMRLVGMLDSAAAYDPSEETSFDRDELFGRITQQVSEPTEAPLLTQGLLTQGLLTQGLLTQGLPAKGLPAKGLPAHVEIAQKAIEVHEEYQRRAPWGYIVAAIAACALAISFVPRLIDDASAPFEPSSEHLETVELILDDEERLEDLPTALANLTPQTLDSKVLNVFASDQARWSLEGEEDLLLNLDHGVLLVEYLPGEATTLTVSSPGLQARILGTVFYVFAEEERLGVLSGKVEVSHRQKAERKVVAAGEEVDRDLVIETIAAAVREKTDPYIDLEAHEEKIASNQGIEVMEAKGPTSSSAAPKAARARPEETTRSSRREHHTNAARRAMAARDYAEAARQYEALLTELPEADPAAMTIRLDLARVYRQHLRQPERSIVHLRAFVMNRPDDVAAPSAVEELCRLLADSDQTDPLCVGR